MKMVLILGLVVIQMIDVSEWGNFKVGDLFDIHPTTAYKMTNKVLMVDDGINPVIVNSGFNNGVGGFTNQKCTEEAGVITFTDTAAKSSESFFYQDKDFVGYPHVQGMYCKQHKLNVYEGRFIATVLRSTAGKFDFIIKMTRDEVLEFNIKLPITSTGEPDWQYMENYMKAVMEESEKSIENLKKADDTKNLIDVSMWGEFKVGDLFEKLDLKCHKKNFNKAIDCSEEQTEEFSLPLTNAKHFNNGIQFYGRPEDWESAEMTIDIVSNGAIATGDVYAQPQRTGVLWDSYLIKCKYEITSELILQYMACVIQRCIKQYFGWDDKCTWDKVKKQMIKLPITSTGEPDWQYMEDYMKHIVDKCEQQIKTLSLAAIR